MRRSSSIAKATITAAEAYETIRHSLPVMKAWEQVDARRDEDLAYVLFDGTRLARRRNGQIRMDRPQDMPLMLPPHWTRERVHDHVRSIPELEITCGIGRDDLDAFLRTGRLPGTSRSRHYRQLEAELEWLTDDKRVDSHRFHGWTAYRRPEAIKMVAERYRDHQQGTLEARVEHHMVGSRRGHLSIHRQVVHILWRRLVDREIALATLRAYGRKCTMADYNRIASAWSIPCGPDGSRNRGISSLRHTHRAAFILASAVVTPMPRRNVAEAIASVPARLKEITGSAQLWRSAISWSDPQLIPLARILSRMSEDRRDGLHPLDAYLGCSLLSRLAERGPWPPLVLNHLSWMDETEMTRLVPFLPALHAGVLEARRRRRLKPFISSIVLVTDMLSNLHEDDYLALARNASHATWARLDERQGEWHRVMAAIRREEQDAEDAMDRSWDDDASWPPLLESYSEGQATAEEIVDVPRLDAEALEQEHCVDGYAPRCISGLSRIFSLRTGEHRSTLELRMRYGVWHVAQHYAAANTIPPRTLDAFGKSVARAVNRIERQRARA